jgi:transposase InsO family protein
VKNVRYEFVLRALSGGLPFVELCREYEIQPKTGYKWKERFLQEGLAGLVDRSRRPHSSPNQLQEEVVCELVRLKRAHDSWGPRKIRELYVRAHPGLEVPSESSIKRILEKSGLVQKRRRRRPVPSGSLQTRTQSQEPNDIWTVDFKGWWYTVGGERCEPLTVRDDFTRYVLCASVPGNARSETVRQEFERLFTRYGVPRTIRSDNGRPFAMSRAPLGLSRLSAWWLALGIHLDRIDRGCPSQNGRHERLHRDIACELENQIEGGLEAQAAALEVWRRTFNHERPHEALGMRCPGELYRKSPRKYRGTPERMVYPAGYRQRKVNAAGQIKIEGTRIRLTKSLQGWNVGLQQRRQPRQLSVYFGKLCVGWIDLETESFQVTNSSKQDGREPAAVL